MLKNKKMKTINFKYIILSAVVFLGTACNGFLDVELDDQIMLATSKGQSIRVPVQGISFRSRNAGGVKVFDTGRGEEVVSVAWIAEQGEDDEAGDTAPPQD